MILEVEGLCGMQNFGNGLKDADRRSLHAIAPLELISSRPLSRIPKSTPHHPFQCIFLEAANKIYQSVTTRVVLTDNPYGTM